MAIALLPLRQNCLMYVHDAPQPVLVVDDLKLGQSKGQIALWVGSGTVAHFANPLVSK